MSALITVGDSLREAFFMFWETLWALVLGFGLPGAVRAFVSRGRMQRVMGGHGPAALTRSSLLGMASSSARTPPARWPARCSSGADFTAAMVFMFASTNLVAELGIVLWLLIGWQFTLAEFAGGANLEAPAVRRRRQRVGRQRLIPARRLAPPVSAATRWAGEARCRFKCRMITVLQFRHERDADTV